MKAVKANRVYTITEAEQKSFINQGYDIYDDHGNCVAYGAGKTVPYGKYKKALEHIALLEAENGDLRKALSEKKPKSKGSKKEEPKEEAEIEK